MAKQGELSILCVCLGNICRSPIGEAIFAQKGKELGLSVFVDSAGTSAYHQGDAPDSRMQKAAKVKGYDLSRQRSRPLRANDFSDFDFILAMDEQNLHGVLQKQQSAGVLSKKLIVKKSLSFLPESSSYYGLDDVPDPYYGDGDGFVKVIEMLEDAADGFYTQLLAERGS